MPIYPMRITHNWNSFMLLLFIKEKLEMIMKAELNSFLTLQQKNLPNNRNGYYHRSLDTIFGRLENLAVPRDRRGEFRTSILDYYQLKEGWLEQAIVRMYRRDRNYYEIEKIITEMIGSFYSEPIITNIISTVIEDINSWQQRRLDTCFEVLSIDRIFIKLYEKTETSESIYLLHGINEEGSHEIVGFYDGNDLKKRTWKKIFSDIKNRGVNEIQLGVFEQSNIKEAFQLFYPDANWQKSLK